MTSYWTRIKRNPVYQRERGRWGEPNPFFARLNRYSPFIIIGIFIFTVCCGWNSAFTGLDPSYAVMWAVLCLPNLAMQGLSWAVVILVPALTAPSISEEMRRGTWDILRLTPQPLYDILLAKVFGSLGRLKIWWPMLIVSIIQAAGAVVGVLGSQLVERSGSGLVMVSLLALSLVVRPWLETICVALIGITASTVAASARAALVGSYAAVLLIRFFVYIASFTITFLGAELLSIGVSLISLANLFGTLFYLFLAAGLFGLLYWQAQRLAFGESGQTQ